MPGPTAALISPCPLLLDKLAPAGAVGVEASVRRRTLVARSERDPLEHPKRSLVIRTGPDGRVRPKRD